MCEGKTENRNERNIMILFLSNFLFDDLNRDKVSENGEKLPQKNMRKSPTNYRITRLDDDGQEDVITLACIQTNEAPIKDVLFNLNGKPLDAFFCFVSEKVGGRGTFAGKTVKVWDSPQAEQPKEYKNHIELFWERLQSINEDDNIKNLLKTPLTKEQFHMVDFNESASDPSAECIRATLDLEDKIRQYIEQEENADGKKLSMKNCNVYADITGGMRTANMAMSAAVQLLQYDGAHLQRVVYSDFSPGRDINPVSNVQPINDLYKLVAGVYAFTQYGRSEALKDYFGDEKYQPLIALRKAMDDFSEAVQLCQEGMFETALGELTTQIESFSAEVENESNKSAKVALFARMIPNLRAIYFDLLAKDAQGCYLKDGEGNYQTDRLEIIRWCVKNKLLQQAVTFCTEWLPEYLINHGVAYVVDKGIQEYLKNAPNDNHKNDPVGKEFFLRTFLSESRSIDNLSENSYGNAIKSLIQDMEQQSSTVSVKQGVLPEDFIQAFKAFWKSKLKDLKIIKGGHYSGNTQLEAIADYFATEKTGRKRENITDASVVRILNKWAEKDLDKYSELFGLPQQETVQYISKNQSGNAARRTQMMLNKGQLKTDIAAEAEFTAVYYIEHYTYIRTKLRNKINHADAGGDSADQDKNFKMEVDYIANYLNGYLDNLELLKDKPKPHFTGLWAENETWNKKKEEASK